MQIVVHGKGLEITATLREYAEAKIGKIAEFFGNIQRVEVELEARPIKDTSRSQVCQVTLWAAGKTLRAQIGSADLYASIDMTFEKIEKQIKEYKERLIRETRRRAIKLEESLAPAVPLKPKEAVGPVIVKVKRFALKPITPVEAAEEMELLGHDFFMFLNSKTHEVNVVYRRKTGNYGLIEPEL